MSISIVLADDQPLLRRGFRMILETEDDLTVVADDTDERGLMFAAHMQPLLDECVMEAQQQ